MKKNTSVFTDFLYRLTSAGILSGAVILCFSGFFGIIDVTWKHGIVLFLSVVLFSFIMELKRRQQIYVLSVGIAAPFLLVASVGRERCGLAWRKFLDLPMGKGENLADDRIFIELMWICAVSISVCLLQLLLESYFCLKIVAVLTFFGWLLSTLWGKWQVPKTGIVFFVLYGAIAVAQGIRLGRKKTENGSEWAFILWIMPFMVLYFGILCLMPAPENPYGWQWAKDIYQRAEEKVTMYLENLANGKREDMDNAVSGFSEEAGLLSGVKTENNNLMKIEVPGGKNLSFYLTGKIYDTFDGREWKSTNRDSRKERLLDTAETVYALERYADSDDEDFYRIMRMEVEYQFFHSGYLLAPSKTWEAEGKKKRFNYTQEGADFVLGKKAGYGTKYRLKFCQLNMDPEQMQDFLLCDLTEDERAWKRALEEYSGEKITPLDLSAYRESVKMQYSEMPGISSETKEWLFRITEAAETDVEKMYCIESALADMEYNINPGKLPEQVTDEESFLDYFLLEKREGYCVYFATAFVLLARAEGFPARYVQGFCVPAGNGTEIAVRSGMAHAWPEVYIEGKGWIPFEPTPGYDEKRYAVRKENTLIKHNYVNDKEQMWEEDESSETEALDVLPEDNMRKPKELSRWALYAGRIALFVIASGILAFAADRVGEKHREKRRSLSEKYRIAVLQNLQMLSMLGYERQQSETYHELAERIRHGIADEQEMPVAFIETYERALYGTMEIGQQELAECFRQRERLLEMLKKNKGKRYLFCRIKLYIMRYR